jgi:hypothetical protein
VERENANANKAARWQQELDAAALAAGQHAGNVGQGDGNNGMQAPAAPANHQQHEPRRNRLCARDLLRYFEQDGHEVYNSPQANLGEALVALGQLEDTPVVRCLQANLRITTAQIEEKGPGYSRSTASSYSMSRSEDPHQQHCSNGPIEPVAEEGRGENEVMQSVNPATNAAANPATNAAANRPANAATNAAGNVANNAVNAASAQANAAANPGENVGAQPPPAQANRAEGSQRRLIRDEVEIERRANYDRDHEDPDALDANNPVQETELQNMHDQELL